MSDFHANILTALTILVMVFFMAPYISGMP